MVCYNVTDKVSFPIQECLDFLNNNQIPAPGETAKLRDGILCIGGAYETIPEQDAIWEAHKKYVDLHCIVSGEEKIGICPVSQCLPGTYHSEDDFFLAEAKANEYVTMRPGIALCLFPEDVHKVKVRLQPNEPVAVKKVVFKIPVAQF